jgi:hypothetical protein
MIAAHQYEERAVGTWDIGPFENDMAADFAHALDEAAPTERENLVRAVLIRAAESRDYLESPEGAEAVAAAALIAEQCGGEPVSRSYGPADVLPVFADSLRSLAVLGRVRKVGGGVVGVWCVGMS